MVAQILALGLQVLFARLLGPSEFGVYSFVFAGLGMTLIAAKLGLDTTLVRLVAEHSARGDLNRARGLVRVARVAGPFSGMVVASLVLLLSVTVWSGGSSALFPAIAVAAALLPFAVLSELTAASLRGLRRAVAALVGDGLARPCVAGAGIVGVAVSVPESLTGASALLAYMAGTIVSLVVSSVILGRSLPAGTAIVSLADVRRYLGISLPLMLAGGLQLAMYSLDTLMLGVLVDTTTAGYYSVAMRVAMVALFVMNAAQMVAAPMLAAAAASGQSAALRSVVRTLNGLALGAALPVCAVVLIAAEPILAIFGPEFREGATALRVLVLAQLLNVLTGPTGIVLSMTGHERSLAVLLFGGVVVNAVLNLLWIPVYGLVGAAAAGLVAHACWNLAGVALIRSRFGVDVSSLDLLRPDTGRMQ